MISDNSLAQFRLKVSGSKRKEISDTSSTVELSSNVPMVKRRRYIVDYISFGFTSVELGGEDRQCVICFEILAADIMKPCNLQRHLSTKHGIIVDNSQKKQLHKLSSVPEKALLHGLLNIRLDLLPRRPFGIYRQTILLIYTDSIFIMVFGYGESTGTIFEVRGIVVLPFRRHLMMTSQIYLISS